ncbi:hypothetical protein Taro_002200, partial [Colocasia esculenta]|nr:hypothetical protein [Colocasia esculenta]
ARSILIKFKTQREKERQRVRERERRAPAAYLCTEADGTAGIGEDGDGCRKRMEERERERGGLKRRTVRQHGFRRRGAGVPRTKPKDGSKVVGEREAMVSPKVGFALRAKADSASQLPSAKAGRAFLGPLQLVTCVTA